MKRIQFIITGLLSASLFFSACGGSEDKKEESAEKTETKTDDDKAKEQAESHGTEVKAADVTLTTPVNAAWVTAGKSTYELKCQSCHKLTDERLVGPGWKDVTKRREPHWIMNMITNVEMMLEKDPEAQKLLEQCLVRMPNQNLTTEQSREVLEFMRSNDGIK